MNWFKKKYSVCTECQVHFEPATGTDADRWPDLCPTHRKPVKERDLRKSAVMTWALQNWEKLEPQYLEDRKISEDPLAAWAKMQYKAQSGSWPYDSLAQTAYQQMKPQE